MNIVKPLINLKTNNMKTLNLIFRLIAYGSDLKAGTYYVVLISSRYSRFIFKTIKQSRHENLQTQFQRRIRQDRYKWY